MMMTTTTTTEQQQSRPRVRLEVVEVPRPCPADWDAMAAVDGDRVRHCRHCDKSVYNLSAMPRAAAERFMADRYAAAAVSGEHLCIRLYKRADGTAVTADCGGRWRAAAGRRLARWGGAVGAVALVVLAAFGGRGSRAQTVPMMGTPPPFPTSGPTTSPAMMGGAASPPSFPTTAPATRPLPVTGKVAVPVRPAG